MVFLITCIEILADSFLYYFGSYAKEKVEVHADGTPISRCFSLATCIIRVLFWNNAKGSGVFWTFEIGLILLL